MTVVEHFSVVVAEAAHGHREAFAVVGEGEVEDVPQLAEGESGLVFGAVEQRQLRFSDGSHE